jgi:hypothetical protein
MKRSLGGYFKTIGNDKVEEWWALLPHNLVITSDWININLQLLNKHISPELSPYLNYVAVLYNRTIEISSHGISWEAVIVARTILERIAYIEVIATNQELSRTTTKRKWCFFKQKTTKTYSPDDILAAISSSDKKLRTQLSRLILERCEDIFPDLVRLYNHEFSQYFTHVSNFDQVISRAELSSTLRETYKNRLQFMPLLLLMETGEVICKGMELLFDHYGINPTGRRTQGKPGHEYSILAYNRLCFRVMMDQHNKQLPLGVRALLNNIGEFGNRRIGLTDIYRGGMQVVIYGDVSHPPSDERILGLSVMGIGPNQRPLRLKVIDQGNDWIKYEIQWRKHIEVTQTAVSFVAMNLQNENLEMPEYMNSLISFLERKLKESECNPENTPPNK